MNYMPILWLIILRIFIIRRIDVITNQLRTLLPDPRPLGGALGIKFTEKGLGCLIAPLKIRKKGLN